MQESSKTFGDLELAEIVELKRLLVVFASTIESSFHVPVSRIFLKDSGGELQVGIEKLNSRFDVCFRVEVPGDSNG